MKQTIQALCLLGAAAFGLSAQTIVAEANLGIQGNKTNTLLYAIPSGDNGMYRISCYVVLTQAASTSSVLPSCGVAYYDNDTAVLEQVPFTLTSALNTVGLNSATFGADTEVFNPTQAGGIYWYTVGYASVGATVMLYDVHVRLEYLGA